MKQISCPLFQAAEKYPLAPAIIRGSRTLTWAELEHTVSAVAAFLELNGLSAESRIAFQIEDRALSAILLLSVIRLNATACPISTRLPQNNIRALLAQIDCQVLITDNPVNPEYFGDFKYFEVNQLLDRASTVEWVKGNTPYVNEDQKATIIYTSGSTGNPKAALHTFANHYYNALGSNENITVKPGDRWLLSLPLYHVGGVGILFRCLLSGATIVVPDETHALERAIPRFDVTHVSLVSTQLLRLLKSVEPISGLKAILLGGSSFESTLIDEAFRRGLPVHMSYGLTEMASQVTTTPPDATRDKLNTSGKVLPFREIMISPDEEILVRGETLFMGYIEGERCLPHRDRDGWFHTGDLGELDHSGYLIVKGRKDNLFISGGENIQPEEIEDSLCQLKGIVRAIVVPVVDKEFGYRPVAFIQTENMDHESETEPSKTPKKISNELKENLVSELESVLPRFKIPVAFFQLNAAFLQGGLKIDRKLLQNSAQQFWENRNI